MNPWVSLVGRSLEVGSLCDCEEAGHKEVVMIIGVNQLNLLSAFGVVLASPSSRMTTIQEAETILTHMVYVCQRWELSRLSSPCRRLCNSQEVHGQVLVVESDIRSRVVGLGTERNIPEVVCVFVSYHRT